MTTATATAHASVVYKSKQPDIIVFNTSYEDRLVRDADTLGGEVEWEGCCERGAIPLMAGGRIISPEEIDISLCERLGLDVESDWTSIDLTTRAGTQPAPTGELFWHFGAGDEALREWEYGSACEKVLKERSAIIRADPRMWRDSLVVRRAEIVREVREACISAGMEYEITHGLCCLNSSMFPFQVAEWMREMCYCACFSSTSMHDIVHIETAQHNILVASFDAESG